MTSAGYWVETTASATKMPMDSGDDEQHRDPEELHVRGRGPVEWPAQRQRVAAMAMITTPRHPASTIRPSTSWSTLEVTLQITSAAMITFTTTIAMTGECEHNQQQLSIVMTSTIRTNIRNEHHS